MITLHQLHWSHYVAIGFRDHPRLQRLFEWRTQLLHEHNRTDRVGYESALQEVRERRGWAR
jgi:hypothetical protein